MSKIKINVVQTVLAIGINAVIGFAFYNYARSAYKIVFGITSGLLLAVIFFLMTGIKYATDKVNLNTKMLSAVFYGIFIITNLIFMFINFKLPIFFIVTGILFFSYLIIYTNIQKTKQ